VRVTRCFAFLDLSGFTALTDARGDEHAVVVLTRFRSLLREVCSRRGVRIAKWLGDGAMLVSVDTHPVLEAVLELQFATMQERQLISIRAGVTEGPVILYEGDDYIGHAVNVAARLCDQAEGGGILALPSVTAAVPKWGAVTGSVELEVPGLTRLLGVVELGLRPLQHPTFEDPVCGIPLRREVAEVAVEDALGQSILFCSLSCHDTWSNRPPPPPEEHGSVRAPLIGT
jgi:adenylate cyclase